MAKEKTFSPPIPALADCTRQAPAIAGLPPLEETCETCQGTGQVSNGEEWNEWRKKRTAGETVGPPFFPETRGCEACRGRGTVPTEEGTKLLVFLRRHPTPLES